MMKEKKERKIKRRFWVHPILESRISEGEYHTLYPPLIDDETKFYNYFRMSIGTFEEILSKIQHELIIQDTTFREAITPREKISCVFEIRYDFKYKLDKPA